MSKTQHWYFWKFVDGCYVYVYTQKMDQILASLKIHSLSKHPDEKALPVAGALVGEKYQMEMVEMNLKKKWMLLMEDIYCLI